MSVLFPTSWDAVGSSGPSAMATEKQSKKRKRPSTSNQYDDVDLGRVQINIDKLMGKMRAEEDRLNKKGGKGKTKAGDVDRMKEKKKQGKDSAGVGVNAGKGSGSLVGKDAPRPMKSNIKAVGSEMKGPQEAGPTLNNGKKRKNRTKHSASDQSNVTKPPDSSSSKAQFPSRPKDISSEQIDARPKKALKKSNSLLPGSITVAAAPNPASEPVPHRAEQPLSKDPASSSKVGLTAMQAKMKSKLDGSRFRWINEQLYTCSSEKARSLMKEQPSLYNDYHTGFTTQVASWPSPPLAALTASLTALPKSTLIADLGSGPAKLAQALVPTGHRVLSYDLVGDDWVVEADFCDIIPLPGSADDDAESAIIDVCVCALSLMSLNWIAGIREARRVTKKGGQLKIAEVTSRFTDVQAFIDLVCEVGYKFISKDDQNSHFVLFDFVRTPRSVCTTEEWTIICQRADGLLKPCEYKRR